MAETSLDVAEEVRINKHVFLLLTLVIYWLNFSYTDCFIVLGKLKSEVERKAI